MMLALVYCSVGQMRMFIFGYNRASCRPLAGSCLYFAVASRDRLIPEHYQGFHRRRLALCTATSLTHAFTSLRTALQPATVCDLNSAFAPHYRCTYHCVNACHGSLQTAISVLVRHSFCYLHAIAAALRSDAIYAI